MSDVDLVPLKSHYEHLLAHHGDTAEACSWKNEEVALRNFAAIAQVFEQETEPFTVYEVGCGLGMFRDFLEANVHNARYSGCDIVSEMIARARRRRPDTDVEVRDILRDLPDMKYDYVVVSGLFNLRMQHDDDRWFGFITAMLRAMFACSRKGVAANFLTTHVDWKRELGYYQDPSQILDFALRELSRFSEIRHSYYPWEFALFSYHSPKALPFGPPPVAWPPQTRERPDEKPY